MLAFTERENHSVRKTCISRLLDADVPENFVAQLSGHKSTESLQSYKSASAKHQKNVKIVQNERKCRIVIDSDEDDWLWSYFLSTLSSFELIFTASLDTDLIHIL